MFSMTLPFRVQNIQVGNEIGNLYTRVWTRNGLLIANWFLTFRGENFTGFLLATPDFWKRTGQLYRPARLSGTGDKRSASG
jgi:hypothetical protein